MKKVLLASIIISITLLVASCQKEHELVTLGAVISQTGKTYIDDRYPCWNNGDQVFVNNNAYPISAASGPSGQIANVVSADGYRALFPASLVTSNMDITNSSSIPVTLPATQVYTLVDGHQRVDAPMGAYTTGEILQFHNLCSIVHVVVNNNTGSDMALDKLCIAADNAYLSGAGTATVTGADDDGITLSSDASHSVSLRIAGPTSVTLAAGAQAAFDIYVPAFSTDNVTLTLYTTNGYYFDLTKSGVALAPNTYTTVTLNVTSLTQILAAELVTGQRFNAAIPRNATSVVFEYNSSVTSGTLLSTVNSPASIYGNLDGTTWKVSTNASMIKANPNCSDMFKAYYNSGHQHAYLDLYIPALTEIHFGDGFNTSNVMIMDGMFDHCWGIEELDLSMFNTSNVVSLRGMFHECQLLSSLNLSSFNTSNVEDMGSMFMSCYSITNIDLSNFNTRNVTSLSQMFTQCRRLTSLDLSNFNTENVIYMGGMFSGCNNLTSLDITNFNTENVIEMASMFGGCSSLTSLDLSNFNTENVTNMVGMFTGCSSLTSLDLSNFNTANVTYMGSMFYDCSGLTSLNISNFNTENVTSMSGMFYGCSNLTSLNLSNFNTGNVTDMHGMFGNCSSLMSLNLSSFNTENVTSMGKVWGYSIGGMFEGCSSLTSLDLSSFNTENVTNMSNMFSGCSSLSSLDLSIFNTENVTYMNSMFMNCSNLISLDVSNFNTENVELMDNMFDGCSSLTSLDLSNFNTANVMYMPSLFYNCSSLTSLDLSHFDMSNVYSKGAMCYNLSTTSGACTIICPAAVRTELESGTGLPTSGVAFTWVTPTSK